MLLHQDMPAVHDGVCVYSLVYLVVNKLTDEVRSVGSVS